MVRFLLLTVGILSMATFAQSSDEVAREIQRLKTLADEERRGISADSARQATWQAQSRARIASMRSDAARLARERDSLRGLVERESRPKPPAPPPKSSASVRREALAAVLATEIEKTLPLVSGVDSQVVADRWTGLVKGLRAGRQVPDEALARFLDDLSERLDLASSIRVRAGSRTGSDGRTRKGHWIDLGTASQAFVDREGQAADWKLPNGKWIPLDPKSVKEMTRAARVLSGEGNPAWIQLPVRAEVAK
ncbi:MAG: hypothetical protein IPK50_23200 [Fibrobacterota bacterium]|nr:hypothetical protein [Fibrobacterota bacterium]QQS05141.1 MAG: hypothetical protein IPK50_23200 [Fibrobacterota bacterium]